MAEASDGQTDILLGAEQENCDMIAEDAKKQELPKQESVVLYTQAALRGGKMGRGTGRSAKRPCTVVLRQVSEPASKIQLRKVMKENRMRTLQEERKSIDKGNGLSKNYLSHGGAPGIVISDLEEMDNGNDDEVSRTPLPVLPVLPPESDSEDGDEEDNGEGGGDSLLPSFLSVTQRYRRSSLVRMDAITPPGGTTPVADEDGRRISVHGSLDIPRPGGNALAFRNAVSVDTSEREDTDDMVSISELHTKGNLLAVPSEKLGRHKRKGSKRNRPSLRRMLTLAVSSAPPLDREELEEKKLSKKREKEERRKERKERKLKEKLKREAEMYDEEGVSAILFPCPRFIMSFIYDGLLMSIHA